ncbi:MAG: peptidase S8 [Acidimicrobiales bacterium]
MRPPLTFLAVAATGSAVVLAAVVLAGGSAPTRPVPTPSVHAAQPGAAARPGSDAGPGFAVADTGVHPRELCRPSTAQTHCNAYVLADATGQAQYLPFPSGLTPADLQSAYGLGALVGARGSDQTIGIVAAFDNPNAEADMNQYRAAFGLPPCSTANGCFRKVDQAGVPETRVPTASGSSGLTGQDAIDVGGETSLDLDMVSATCPRCHLLLVDAFTESGSDLAASAKTAARLGAQVVSTSYGGLEGGNDQAQNDQLYNTPGTVQLASSGDGGYGVEYPAVSPFVIAVGGTTLERDNGPRKWKEKAWSGAGGGCSTTVPKPSWQRDPLCPSRSVSDVSADADPRSGVSVYDTYGAPAGRPWLVVGGTSASSPMVAGMIGLAGNATSMGQGASYLYAHRSAFHDVVGGQTKGGCGDYTCRGDIGYDSPTGLGSPDGVAGL